MIKTVLLLIAVTAVMAWPKSRDMWTEAFAERYTMAPEWGEYSSYDIRFWAGRLVVTRQWHGAKPGNLFTWIRMQVEESGDGWRFETKSDARKWSERDWPSRWGIFRWNFYDRHYPQATIVYREFAAPLWFVALVAGAWPLASIAFAFRRWRKRRRAVREGRCVRCGYDLRATPAAGGELLAVCPECGAASSTRNTPSPPPS
jgi:hypothetical protein